MMAQHQYGCQATLAGPWLTYRGLAIPQPISPASRHPPGGGLWG